MAIAPSGFLARIRRLHPGFGGQAFLESATHFKKISQQAMRLAQAGGMTAGAGNDSGPPSLTACPMRLRSNSRDACRSRKPCALKLAIADNTSDLPDSL
jgi:hypothetical protein